MRGLQLWQTLVRRLGNRAVPMAVAEATPLAPRSRDAGEIQAWLVARLADVLGLPPDEIDPGIPLDRYGLDSRTAAMLSGDLEEWLGRALPATLIWDYPTVDQVATHLAAPPDQVRPARRAAEGGGA